MKVYKGRGSRFAAVPNETVDDHTHLDLTTLGLLTHLLRHADGFQEDVLSISRKRGPGRDQCMNAMRKLVRAGYVVKVKYQDASTGRWETDSYVFDKPATADEVGSLSETYADYKSVRVESKHHTDRLTGTRQSVVTCGNTTSSQVDPGDGFPTVGGPTVGKGSPKREDEQEDEQEDEEHSPPPPPSGTTASEPRLVEGGGEDTLGDPDSRWTAEAWLVLRNLPTPMAPGRTKIPELAPLAAAALADGWSVRELTRQLTPSDIDTIRYPMRLLERKLRDLPLPPNAKRDTSHLTDASSNTPCPGAGHEFENITNCKACRGEIVAEYRVRGDGWRTHGDTPFEALTNLNNQRETAHVV